VALPEQPDEEPDRTVEQGHFACKPILGHRCKTRCDETGPDLATAGGDLRQSDHASEQPSHLGQSGRAAVGGSPAGQHFLEIVAEPPGGQMRIFRRAA